MVDIVEHPSEATNKLTAPVLVLERSPQSSFHFVVLNFLIKVVA